MSIYEAMYILVPAAEEAEAHCEEQRMDRPEARSTGTRPTEQRPPAFSGGTLRKTDGRAPGIQNVGTSKHPDTFYIQHRKAPRTSCAGIAQKTLDTVVKFSEILKLENVWFLPILWMGAVFDLPVRTA